METGRAESRHDVCDCVWRSRGYLPHFDSPDATQHITFHLADSLPASVLDRFRDETRCLPLGKREAERRKRAEAWMDSGVGSCSLREPGVAAMTQNALLFFDGQRYRLLAWVVMPNHVHVLFQPIGGWTVAKTVASWKRFTAQRIARRRGDRHPGSADLLISMDCRCSTDGGAHPGRQAVEPSLSGPSSGPVWHREYWDRFIRNEQHYLQTVEYIHQNPVKAGLAAQPEEWPWSSARSPDATDRVQSAGQEVGGPRGGAKS